MVLEDRITKEILSNIGDPSQRKMIADIMTSRIQKKVLCMSKICKGRIVAYIYDTGKVSATTDEGIMWLFASRPRLDGSMGFQCRCGNDSRLCQAEKGVKGIEENSVQKKDLEQVWKNLQNRPANYPVIGKEQNVDNFKIVEI